VAKKKVSPGERRRRSRVALEELARVGAVTVLAGRIVMVATSEGQIIDPPKSLVSVRGQGARLVADFQFQGTRYRIRAGLVAWYLWHGEWPKSPAETVVPHDGRWSNFALENLRLVRSNRASRRAAAKAGLRVGSLFSD